MFSMKFWTTWYNEIMSCPIQNRNSNMFLYMLFSWPKGSALYLAWSVSYLLPYLLTHCSRNSQILYHNYNNVQRKVVKQGPNENNFKAPCFLTLWPMINLTFPMINHSGVITKALNLWWQNDNLNIYNCFTLFYYLICLIFKGQVSVLVYIWPWFLISN